MVLEMPGRHDVEVVRLETKGLGASWKATQLARNFRIEEETPEMSSTGLDNDQAVSSLTYINLLDISPTRLGSPIYVYW